MIDRRTRTVATALRVTLAACVTTNLIGCATKPGGTIEPTREGKVDRSAVLHSLDRALEERILALDPERISDYDVRSTLAAGPTPRIILLHASVYPVYLIMTSFATFLERMGYPGAKLRDPFDGARVEGAVLCEGTPAEIVANQAVRDAYLGEHDPQCAEMP